MPAICFLLCFFFLAFIKNNCVFCWADHRLAPPLSHSSSLGQHKPCIPRRDDLCLPHPTGTDRRQTEGPLLFLLWFLAASARFLHVYHCNQQARPRVSQAAWNKAAWTAEHKIGEAFLSGYWEEESVFSLSSVSFPLFVTGGQFFSFAISQSASTLSFLFRSGTCRSITCPTMSYKSVDNVSTSSPWSVCPIGCWLN